MLWLHVADLYEAYSTDLSYCGRSTPEPGETTHLRSQLVYCLCPASLTVILVLYPQRGSTAIHSIDIFGSRDFWLNFDPLGTQNPVLNCSTLLKFLPA